MISLKQASLHPSLFFCPSFLSPNFSLRTCLKYTVTDRKNKTLACFFPATLTGIVQRDEYKLAVLLTTLPGFTVYRLCFLLTLEM